MPGRLLYSVGSMPVGYPLCLRRPTSLNKLFYPIPVLFSFLLLLSLVGVVSSLSLSSSSSVVRSIVCGPSWHVSVSWVRLLVCFLWLSVFLFLTYTYGSPSLHQGFHGLPLKSLLLEEDDNQELRRLMDWFPVCCFFLFRLHRKWSYMSLHELQIRMSFCRVESLPDPKSNTSMLHLASLRSLDFIKSSLPDAWIS